ncbi:metallopeptidase [Patescibacteria group bacterium]|nr:metallopeptidase [Patescibacteria group bacterium]
MANLIFTKAPDLEKEIKKIVKHLELNHIDANNVSAFRSTGSTARARARIYAMPRIWQQALDVKPHYCIEFISEHFSDLKYDHQQQVIIHELLHIPKTFSGALVPHRGRGRSHQVTHRVVNKLYKQYKKNLDLGSGKLK